MDQGATGLETSRKADSYSFLMTDWSLVLLCGRAAPIKYSPKHTRPPVARWADCATPRTPHCQCSTRTDRPTRPPPGTGTETNPPSATGQTNIVRNEPAVILEPIAATCGVAHLLAARVRPCIKPQRATDPPNRRNRTAQRRNPRTAGTDAPPTHRRQHADPQADRQGAPPRTNGTCTGRSVDGPLRVWRTLPGL